LVWCSQNLSKQANGSQWSSHSIYAGAQEASWRTHIELIDRQGILRICQRRRPVVHQKDEINLKWQVSHGHVCSAPFEVESSNVTGGAQAAASSNNLAIGCANIVDADYRTRHEEGVGLAHQ